MNKNITCPTCNGKGVVPNPNGKRKIPWWINLFGWLLSKDDQMICNTCDGMGTVTQVEE